MWNSQLILILVCENNTEKLASFSLSSYIHCYMADLFGISKFLELKCKDLLVVFNYYNKNT